MTKHSTGNRRNVYLHLQCHRHDLAYGNRRKAREHLREATHLLRRELVAEGAVTVEATGRDSWAPGAPHPRRVRRQPGGVT